MKLFQPLTKRNLGDQLEEFAKTILQKQGCQIVELNYLCKLGEIDIIAKDKEALAFIEVRYRKQSSFGGAIASVDHKKQQKIIRAAKLYLQQNGLTNKAICRFDVFAVEGSINRLKYDWIKNAFILN